ncbi:MAG: thiamine phosphate synthase, partial [Phycisphaerales bacterium]
MMPAHFRMIDANANRAREALRVMEDIARFALNDESISRELKQLRHDLRDALRMLPDGVLHANRDTPHDVGTSITTDAEMMRAGMGDLAAAAGKRLTEALRVIEETSKLLPTVPADRIEQLRYAAYELDQRLLAALATGRARQWAICVLLTESLCRRPWREVVQACVEAGADCLQIREKDMDGQELLNR